MSSGLVTIYHEVEDKALWILFFGNALNKEPGNTGFLLFSIYDIMKANRPFIIIRRITMSEFLNFSEISQKVSFNDMLNWLNIPFTQTQNGELKGEGFIITVSKNLYFNPNGEDKGSVINFLSKQKGIDLRSAAQELKKQFLTEQKEPTREIPNLELHYCPFLKERGISEELAKQLEVGFVKQRSIISGKLAFKTYDENRNHSGYVAYNHAKKEWFFPKGFKRTLYNPLKYEGEEVMATVDIFSCIDLIKSGVPSVSLIGKTMTDIQAEQLSQFTRVVLVHPEPDNIVARLAKKAFVKVSPS